MTFELTRSRGLNPESSSYSEVCLDPDSTREDHVQEIEICLEYFSALYFFDCSVVGGRVWRTSVRGGELSDLIELWSKIQFDRVYRYVHGG